MSPRTQSSPLLAAPLVWTVLLALGVWLVVFAVQIRAYFVDDAFTGFQYLHNLLAGEGFVFCAGSPPVEGVTNIGWLLALAPLCTIAEPTLVAKLAGLGLVLATLVLTAGLSRRLAAKIEPPEDAFGLVLFPVVMTAASFEFVYFSLAGMETALLATILVLMGRIAIGRPHSILLPVLGGLAFLVHPEAAAVFPIYAALAWLRAKEERRKQLVGVLILGALLAGITAARFGYFRDVLPNTFHSKPSDLGLAVGNAYAFLMGQNTNVAFPMTGWLAIPLLWLGYRRLRRAAPPAADMLAATCGVGLAMAVYSPPDWTNLARYFAPYLPAALILLWAGVLEVVRRLWGATLTPRTRQAIAAAVALVLVLTSAFHFRTRMNRMEDFPGYVLAAKSLIGPAEWMREHLLVEATIATRRIGALAYYSHRKVFDYAYGLPEPEVARLVARHGGRFDTPTDADLAAVWQARAPDYLLEDGLTIDFIISQAHGVRQRFAIHGIEYRVIKQFPIGHEVQWVLAERIAAQ